MTRKQKIGIILALLFLIIALLLWWWLGRRAPAGPRAVVAPVVSEEIPAPAPEPAPEAAAELIVREQSASLQTLAKVFAERYGSFSTEANFANLEDVLPLMTAEFAVATQAYIDEAEVGDSFYGVTTRVVSVRVDAQDEEAGRAILTLSTQRQEAVDSPQNTRVKYQDLVLTFNKVSGEWKVASANWQ